MPRATMANCLMYLTRATLYIYFGIALRSILDNKKTDHVLGYTGGDFRFPIESVIQKYIGVPLLCYAFVLLVKALIQTNDFSLRLLLIKDLPVFSHTLIVGIVSLFEPFNSNTILVVVIVSNLIYAISMILMTFILSKNDVDLLVNKNQSTEITRAKYNTLNVLKVVICLIIVVYLLLRDETNAGFILAHGTIMFYVSTSYLINNNSSNVVLQDDGIVLIKCLLMCYTTYATMAKARVDTLIYTHTLQMVVLFMESISSIAFLIKETLDLFSSN